jgi:hypothetical protein
MKSTGKYIKDPRITALREELKSIHFANILFWGQGPEHNGASRAEYQHRQDRLQEIRRELYTYVVSQGAVASKSRRSSRALSHRA